MNDDLDMKPKANAIPTKMKKETAMAVTQNEMPGQDSNIPPARTPEGWRIEPGKTGTSGQDGPQGTDRPAGAGTASGSTPGSGPGMLSTTYSNEGGDTGMVGAPMGSESHNSS